MLDPAYQQDTLVDTAWLSKHLEDPDVRVIDLRWRPRFVDGKGIAEDRKEDYLESHIPGAVFLGCVSDLTDPSVKGPTLLVPSEQFERTMARAGIGDDTLVVAYDDAPLPMASARLWWTLQYYGHDKVKVLAGGLRQWKEEGRPLTKVIPQVKPKRSSAKARPEIRATKDTVLQSLEDQNVLIIDCMSFEHYDGSVSRPWGVRDGHIPNAVCLPWLALGLGLERASSSDARTEALSSDRPIHYLPADELRDLFAQVGVTKEKRVITYCGGGYAACHALIALRLTGFENAAAYEGSMAEWSRDPAVPLVKSAEP